MQEQQITLENVIIYLRSLNCVYQFFRHTKSLTATNEHFIVNGTNVAQQFANWCDAVAQV